MTEHDIFATEPGAELPPPFVSDGRTDTSLDELIRTEELPFEIPRD